MCLRVIETALSLNVRAIFPSLLLLLTLFAFRIGLSSDLFQVSMYFDLHDVIIRSGTSLLSNSCLDEGLLTESFRISVDTSIGPKCLMACLSIFINISIFSKKSTNIFVTDTLHK